MTPTTPHEFAAALRSWLADHPHISARQIALEADINPSLIIQYKNGGRPITFDALALLLPVIARHSTRLHALVLHLAYLADKKVQEYRDEIRITLTGPHATHQPPLDIYDRRAADWAARARASDEFEQMWKALDDYMHHHGTEEPQPQPAPLNYLHQSQAQSQTPGDTLRIADGPPDP